MMKPWPEQWKHWEGRTVLYRVVVLAAGAVLGVMGTVTLQMCVRPSAIDIPDGLGDLTAGLATVFAALIGWATFTSWDTQKRKEKRAEVATTALLATMELHRCVDNACARALDVVDRAPQPETRGALARLHEEATDESLHRAFNASQVMVSLFLPPSASELMETFYEAVRMATAAIGHAEYECDLSGNITAGDALLPFKVSTNNQDPLERQWMKDALHAFRDKLHDHLLLR